MSWQCPHSSAKVCKKTIELNAINNTVNTFTVNSFPLWLFHCNKYSKAVWLLSHSIRSPVLQDALTTNKRIKYPLLLIHVCLNNNTLQSCPQRLKPKRNLPMHRQKKCHPSGDGRTRREFELQSQKTISAKNMYDLIKNCIRVLHFYFLWWLQKWKDNNSSTNDLGMS